MELIELGDKPSVKRVYVRREWPSSSTRPRREQRAKGVSQDEEAVQQTFSVDSGAGQRGLSQREAQ